MALKSLAQAKWNCEYNYIQLCIIASPKALHLKMLVKIALRLEIDSRPQSVLFVKGNLINWFGEVILAKPFQRTW